MVFKEFNRLFIVFQLVLLIGINVNGFLKISIDLQWTISFSWLFNVVSGRFAKRLNNNFGFIVYALPKLFEVQINQIPAERLLQLCSKFHDPIIWHANLTVQRAILSRDSSLHMSEFGATHHCTSCPSRGPVVRWCNVDPGCCERCEKAQEIKNVSVRHWHRGFHDAVRRLEQVYGLLDVPSIAL